METYPSNNRILRPLSIVIGIVYVIFAIWTLINAFGTYEMIHPSNIEINGDFSKAFLFLMKVSGYLSLLLNLLFLLWFLLMRKRLNRNGAWLLAVIGLSIAIALGIVNMFVNHFYPLDFGTDIPDSRIRYSMVTGFIVYIEIILMGISFILLNRQLDDKLGKWALIIGLFYLISLLVSGSHTLFNIFCQKHYTIEAHYRITNIINLVSQFIGLAKNIVMAIFFFMFASKEKHMQS